MASSDPDCDSLGSAVAGQAKSTSCFRCHPRRWRHQACCFRRGINQSKTGHVTTASVSKQKTTSSSFSRSATARISRVAASAGCNQDADSDPGSILNTSNHDLQVMPMSAVASMISSVVNQSATMAATTTGGNVPPPRNTFGKRNIKNQVNFSNTRQITHPILRYLLIEIADIFTELNVFITEYCATTYFNVFV